MGLEQFLTEENKVGSLLALKVALIADIEKLLIDMEIDKASFNILEYSPTGNKRDKSQYVSEQKLHRHCQAVKSIDTKIEELGNV